MYSLARAIAWPELPINDSKSFEKKIPKKVINIETKKAYIKVL